MCILIHANILSMFVWPAAILSWHIAHFYCISSCLFVRQVSSRDCAARMQCSSKRYGQCRWVVVCSTSHKSFIPKWNIKNNRAVVLLALSHLIYHLRHLCCWSIIRKNSLLHFTIRSSGRMIVFLFGFFFHWKRFMSEVELLVIEQLCPVWLWLFPVSKCDHVCFCFKTWPCFWQAASLQFGVRCSVVNKLLSSAAVESNLRYVGWQYCSSNFK